MTILRGGEDNRSPEQRRVDEAVRVRVEVHRSLNLLEETDGFDPLKHLAECEACTKHLEQQLGCLQNREALLTEPFPLAKPDEYGDVKTVCAWDNGGGIDIDAPGCGTATLTDDEAKTLMHWLMERYGLGMPW